MESRLLKRQICLHSTKIVLVNISSYISDKLYVEVYKDDLLDDQYDILLHPKALSKRWLTLNCWLVNDNLCWSQNIYDSISF